MPTLVMSVPECALQGVTEDSEVLSVGRLERRSMSSTTHLERQQEYYEGSTDDSDGRHNRQRAAKCGELEGRDVFGAHAASKGRIRGN